MDDRLAGLFAEHLRALTDEEVVDRVRGGEPELFELLMRRYNQRLFRVVRSIARNDDDAEEALQQAYVDAFCHLDQFEGRSRFSTWMTRIALREAGRRASARRPVDVLPLDGASGDEHATESEDPVRAASAREVRGRIEGALDALPSKLATVFVLRVVEGLSTGETARELDVSPAAVKIRLYRARRRLVRALTPALVDRVDGAFPFLGGRCDALVAAVHARLAAPATRAGINGRGLAGDGAQDASPRAGSPSARGRASGRRS